MSLRKTPWTNMRVRLVFCVAVVVFASSIRAQDPPQVDPGRLNGFIRFFRWAVGTPLTVTQEARIRAWVNNAFRNGEYQEIHRFENLLSLRDQIEAFGLHNGPGGQAETQRMARVAWIGRPGEGFAAIGLQAMDYSSRVLAEGNPPLTRQMAETYAEMAWFVYQEATRSGSPTLEADQRVVISEGLTTHYPNLKAADRTALQQVPIAWTLLRERWTTAPEKEKGAFRALWMKALGLPKSKPPHPSTLVFSQAFAQALPATLEMLGGAEAYGAGW